MGVCFWILMPVIWLVASVQVLHAHDKILAVYFGLATGVVVMTVAIAMLVKIGGSEGAVYTIGCRITLAAIILLAQQKNNWI